MLLQAVQEGAHEGSYTMVSSAANLAALPRPPRDVRILTLPPKPVGRDTVEPLQRSKFSDSGLKQAKIGS